MDTDEEWEKWGKKDPYFGVFTDVKYRRCKITEEALEEFFKTGRDDVQHALHTCRRYFNKDFLPTNVLDFGCGTGRCILPFAEIAETVVGLDVSDSMLEEALNNCNRNNVKNVVLLKSDDNLSLLEDCFDLIYSSIVFQHMPVERGKYIFKKLLKHLNPAGIGVFHFTYYRKEASLKRNPLPYELTMKCLRTVKRCIKKIIHYESPSQDPEMQMNLYDLNELMFIIQSEGIEALCQEFTNHDGELGVFLYFQKSGQR